MAERPLIGRGLFLTNRRAANYQRVRTSQAMDTLTEYTCLSILPAFPRVGGKPDHVSSQGKEAVFATHDIYARLRGSKIFSTFDLRSGYHHMALSLEARAKSAFVTPMDTFEFTRCPFGLSQAPAYFQRLINKVIKGLPFAFGYLDDVLIHSPDIETHLQHIRIFFQRLREADLKLKNSKCIYFKTHVQYLGHLVSGKGIRP